MKSDVMRVRFDTLAQSTAIAGDYYQDGKYDEALMSLEEAAEEIGILIEALEKLSHE